MQHVVLSVVLFYMLIISMACRDTTTHCQDDMSDGAKDVSPDLIGDVSIDSLRDLTDDISTDLSRDLGRDVAVDMPTEMSSPAYRRMCINEQPQRCIKRDKTSFGDCGKVIGAVFNGHECVDATGCDDCNGDCPEFDSIESCASSCAGNGWCQAGKMPYLQPVQCELFECIETLAFCISSTTDPTGKLQPFGDSATKPQCSKDNTSCRVAGVQCGETQWCCQYTLPADYLESDEYTQFCGLTLQQNITQVGCFFFSD